LLVNAEIVGPVRWRYVAGTLMAARATRIQLCGRTAVELDGRRVDAQLGGRQSRLLLAYLILHRRLPIDRDRLLEALWPERAPRQPEAALRVLLSRIRRALGEGVIQGRNPLVVNLPEGSWIDVEAAEDAVHRAQSAFAAGKPEAAAWPSLIARAITSRALLPGEHAPWVEERRRWLDELHVEALDGLAAAKLAIGGSEHVHAERTARELIELAPYRESAYRTLMLALARRGELAEAANVYDALRTRLRDDLGMTPSPTTRDLYARVVLEQNAGGSAREPAAAG
jgi:DNA-binding SARP family transcriptional activator